MSRSEKPPDGKNGVQELLKKLWLPVASFLGAVSLIYNAYQMWLGDQATVTMITAAAGLFVLVIVLSWVGFSHKKVTHEAVWPIGEKKTEKVWHYSPFYRKLARVALGIMLLGGVIR